MKLSQKTTIITPEKLHAYVLNAAHPEGKSKAKFLQELGYSQSDWQRLASDLRDQHLMLEASPGKESIYGRKYEIFAPIIGPNGQERWIRSIWMIRTGETSARFVTLIPEVKP